MQAIERSLVSNDWITLVLVGCLVLIAVARVAYESKFVDFSELPLNEKYLLKSSKDIQFEHPFNLILFTVQFLSVSLFLFLVAQKYESKGVSYFWCVSQPRRYYYRLVCSFQLPISR